MEDSVKSKGSVKEMARMFQDKLPTLDSKDETEQPSKRASRSRKKSLEKKVSPRSTLRNELKQKFEMKNEKQELCEDFPPPPSTTLIETDFPAIPTKSSADMTVESAEMNSVFTEPISIDEVVEPPTDKEDKDNPIEKKAILTVEATIEAIPREGNIDNQGIISITEAHENTPMNEEEEEVIKELDKVLIPYSPPVEENKEVYIPSTEVTNEVVKEKTISKPSAEVLNFKSIHKFIVFVCR